MGSSLSAPLLDLSQQHEPLRQEFIHAFEAILEHGKFILGPEVQLLESAIAHYCEVPHAISCANGSDALLLALSAFGLGPGDEVITTPYSFFASTSCIARLGAKAVFADICPHCYNVHPENVLEKITSKTKAIIPVHLYGQAADMNPYLDFARKKGIHIIEDACQAIGARYDGHAVGHFGDVTCISFFPTKNLGALGDAGLMLTQDAKLAHQLSVLRVHGMEPKYHHPLLGMNSRLDTLQAAFLNIKIKHLESYAQKRLANAHFYNHTFVERGLANPVTKHETACPARCSNPYGDASGPFPLVLPSARTTGHVYNQYIVRLRNPKVRDAFREHLTRARVGSEIYYPVPLHLQPCFKNWGYRKGDFPISEAAAESTVALPIFPELAPHQLQHVVDTIAAFDWKSVP